MSSARNRRQKKTSKGLRRNIVAGNYGQFHDVIQTAINKYDAWQKGQNPWITIDTPEKNKLFIRVRANDHWGDYRRRSTIPTSVAE